MNRRAFLKAFGIGTAAMILAPTVKRLDALIALEKPKFGYGFTGFKIASQRARGQVLVALSLN